MKFKTHSNNKQSRTAAYFNKFTRLELKLSMVCMMKRCLLIFKRDRMEYVAKVFCDANPEVGWVFGKTTTAYQFGARVLTFTSKDTVLVSGFWILNG